MSLPLSTPIYTTADSVKIRLANKVQFQTSTPAQDGELPDALLLQLIADAETAVEQKLRSRYTVPFQSKRTNLFKDLPDHTKRAIRRACDLASVIEVLRTDFGRGTHINAEDYFKTSTDALDAYILELLGQDAEAKSRTPEGRFRFSPPLEDLLLAKTNSEADDGYKGAIINTDGSRHDSATYAGEQINDPSRNYVNGRFGPRIVN